MLPVAGDFTGETNSPVSIPSSASLPPTQTIVNAEVLNCLLERSQCENFYKVEWERSHLSRPK